MKRCCTPCAAPRLLYRYSSVWVCPLKACCSVSSLLLLLLGAVLSSRGQALPTATQLSHVAVFIEFEHLSPNVYGNPIERGVAGGIDFNRSGGPIPISFEVRGTFTPTGQFVGQRSGTFGTRFDLRHRHPMRLEPYANFLVGVGEIVFGPSYDTGSPNFHSDNSIVYNFGGGLDYAAAGDLVLQAEFQQQHWNFNNASNPQPFSPTMINIGFLYRLSSGHRHHLPH